MTNTFPAIQLANINEKFQAWQEKNGKEARREQATNAITAIVGKTTKVRKPRAM